MLADHANFTAQVSASYAVRLAAFQLILEGSGYRAFEDLSLHSLDEHRLQEVWRLAHPVLTRLHLGRPVSIVLAAYDLGLRLPDIAKLVSARRRWEPWDDLDSFVSCSVPSCERNECPSYDP